MNDKEMEAYFWANLHLAPPLYGCDIRGSMFNDDFQNQWNLRHLQTCLEDGLGKITLEGINAPYVYFGSLRSIFAWHVEDLNLASLNYHHGGKAKYWYGISKKVNYCLEKIGLILSITGSSKLMPSPNFKSVTWSVPNS